MPTTRSASVVLTASGFAAGVAQVLLLRELLLACFGNEVALGLTLSAWLLCGALGAALAGRHPAADRRAAVQRVAGLANLWAPAVFAALIVVRGYPAMATAVPMALADALGQWHGLERLFAVHLAAQPGEMLGPLHVVLVSALGALAPAGVGGALFAAAMHSYRLARGDDGNAAGRSYALDAVGHLCGGVLLGWAAVVLLNPFTVCCVAAVALCVAVTFAVRQVDGRLASAALGWALVVLLVVVSIPLHNWTRALRWRGRDIAQQVSTLYGEIAVARQGTEGVVFFENGVPTGLSPALPHVPQIVHFALLQHPGPRRVLVIGGGAMGGLQEILKHRPEAVDYAEIDPAMLKLAARWVTAADRRALADPRVTQHAVDGRILVKAAARGARPRYDAIVLLLPDPSTALLNRYYTQEWYAEARRALNPGGVLAWEMSSSRHYLRPALRLLDTSILAAAGASFPGRALMTGDDTLAVVVGGAGAELTDDPGETRRRMQARGIVSPLFAAAIADRLDPYSRDYVIRELGNGVPGAPNRDLFPTAYFNAQATWVGLYYPDLEFASMGLAKLTPGHLWRWGRWAGLGLLLLGAWRPVRRAYAPLAMAVSGLVGMVLTLCVVYAFQAFEGYVYHQVGVLMGMFMVGLAAGAWVAPGGRRPGRGWGLMAAQLGMGALALCLPALLTVAGGLGDTRAAWATSPVMALLMAVVGLAVGVQFPLALRALGAAAGSARTAALVYAADLAGSAVGAATAGAVLIPVLGISATCTACGVLCLGMAGLLALRAAWRG
jgi:spermidine synthase